MHGIWDNGQRVTGRLVRETLLPSNHHTPCPPPAVALCAALDIAFPAPLCDPPQPLSITLRGITNDSGDPGVDVFRTVTLPLLVRPWVHERLLLEGILGSSFVTT